MAHKSHEVNEGISLLKLLLQTILSLVLVVGGVIALAFFFRQELVELSRLVLEKTGILGLFLGMVLSDSLPAFLPPDAFLVMSLAFGFGPWETIFSTTLGSLLGGSIAYGIGRFLVPKISLGRQIVLRYEDKLLPLLRRYGFWAVVIAAITPIPYSWMAYTVGSFKMEFSRFFLASTFRLLRMGIYYFAIAWGWVV